MRPDLVDYVSFILLTAGLLIACGLTKMHTRKRRERKRITPSPAHVLPPPVESRPFLCKLCPIQGICKETYDPARKPI